MPKVYTDYSDSRNKSWCIHCGEWLSRVETTRDHTPSKVLLDRPFPDNLAITPICAACNQSFSLDEEYFVGLLSSILSGSTDPEVQVIEHVKNTLRRSVKLRSLIESQKEEQLCLFGPPDIRWFPDLGRFKNVVIKNSRAHLFFENGEPMLEPPDLVELRPLQLMSDGEVQNFFGADHFQPWCEVGSRWNFRLLEGDNFDEQGFLVVQPGVYRFRIEAGGLGVKSVIREYLATSVFW